VDESEGGIISYGRKKTTHYHIVTTHHMPCHLILYKSDEAKLFGSFLNQHTAHVMYKTNDVPACLFQLLQSIIVERFGRKNL
jgi:hypothetical protein